MKPAEDDLTAELTGLVGAANVIAGAADMARYLEEPRRRFHQGARAVVLPGSVADVQAIARWANERGVPLIPQGGNTGLVGAQVPLGGDEVIVAMRRLRTVREVDAEAGHMTVEAGLTLQEAQETAEAAGAMFPLWIASQGSAEIGGVLSSNAGGVQVLAYGNARELCLGIEAVLADGRLYRGLNALRKNNTGYDLGDLFIGAEGTLGLITAATLKVFPRPVGHETALVNIADPEDALTLFYRVRQRAGSSLTAFELVPRFGIDLQLRHGLLERDPTASEAPWYALVEISRLTGGEPGLLQSALEAAIEDGLIADAVMAESLEDRARMWTMREQMSEVQSREGASIKHDIAVPIAAIPALIEDGIAAARRLVPGIRPCVFGHMGDGNLHFNLSQPAGADRAAFMAREQSLNEAIFEIVARLCGTVSAEHGIGQLRVGLLERVKDPVALEMMRALKKALDPKGILNPGKVLR